MTDHARLTRPPAILTDLRDRLERVIAEDAFPCTTAEARHWLGQVNANIANPVLWEDAHVVFGPNWNGPAIEGVFRDAEFHGRIPADAGTGLVGLRPEPASGLGHSATIPLRKRRAA